MVQIELTDRDSEILRNVLQKHLRELSWEIAFTHKRDSIEFLRERKQFVEGFIQRLDA